MLLTTTTLMIIGGLGFVTWHELINKSLKGRFSFKAMSWHTKLVLRMYFLTSIASSTIFFILERNNSLAEFKGLQKILMALFTGITMKSTGLTIISFATVQLATLIVAMITMFIGSAPLSTGSGIKTSVFAIYLAVIKAAIQGKRHAMMYERHIVDDQVYKAMAIIALSVSWIIFTIFFLFITESNLDFLDVIFTTFSTFSNNGILTHPDIVRSFSILGKIFLIFSMIVGRIGALAIILSMKRIGELRELSYPKEQVILG